MQQINTEQDVLTFGTYTDKTIKYVLTVNPKWLEWARDNVKGFKLSRTVGRQLLIELSKDKL